MLEDLNLCRTDLTNDQVQALFQAMSQNSCLKKLNLGYINLSSVESRLLATTLIKLKVADLKYTHLSTYQMTSILGHIQKDTKLKKLLLIGNNLVII